MNWHTRLAALIPAGTELPQTFGPATVHHLPAALRDDYLQAFGGALSSVYIVAGCLIALAFALAWLFEDIPLLKKAGS